MKNTQKKKIKIHICKRCGYDWASRQDHPVICPKCKTPYWNIPKRD